MFGYIIPMQGELKVRELERFKARYCGLCHSLGKNYGLPARFILSYELVFLSMLISDINEPLNIKRKRCIASPFIRKRYCTQSRSLDLCAGYSVILTWWKMQDSISDESFFRSIPHRLTSCFLHRSYKKAKSDFPEFDCLVGNKLKELIDYESTGKLSIDEAAEKFALILKGVDLSNFDKNDQRALVEALYHLGRWIYIIDACDDIPGDIKYKRYNPVLLRYQYEQDKLTTDSENLIKATLTHSNNLLAVAFELLPETSWSDIIRNIIYLGMPDTCQHVLDGDFPPKCKKGKM
jgi:hypothetical protein